jgi:glycosyltransferase involved in cell wall biosynthesis
MKLLFILTFKGSLEKWSREGIANREMEICFEYLRRDLFTHIQVYSYSPNDREFLDTLNAPPELKQRIELIVPARELRTVWDHVRHSLSLGRVRHAIREGAAICKTNQINGCWTAILARLLGCRMLLRCGYVLSWRLFNNGHWGRAVLALLIEALGFNLAGVGSVTTQDAARYVKRLMPWGKARIFVAPTYVNTDIFWGEIGARPNDRRVLFVGRLVPEKNVLAMIDACERVGASLTMVGQGPLAEKAVARAAERGVDLTYHPLVMNEQIADLMKSHRYFLLPSLHEGLPKVLIEAMATEAICIGTPTSGGRALLLPGRTGYLADGYSADAIARALAEAMSDPGAASIARAARAFVLERHSIAAYADREYGRMMQVLA